MEDACPSRSTVTPLGVTEYPYDALWFPGGQYQVSLGTAMLKPFFYSGVSKYCVQPTESSSPAHGGSRRSCYRPGSVVGRAVSTPQRPAACVIGPALKASAFRITGLQDESVYSSSSPFQVSGC